MVKISLVVILLIGAKMIFGIKIRALQLAQAAAKTTGQAKEDRRQGAAGKGE